MSIQVLKAFRNVFCDGAGRFYLLSRDISEAYRDSGVAGHETC